MAAEDKKQLPIAQYATWLIAMAMFAALGFLFKETGRIDVIESKLERAERNATIWYKGMSQNKLDIAVLTERMKHLHKD